jgi:hypothetical protein
MCGQLHGANHSRTMTEFWFRFHVDFRIGYEITSLHVSTGKHVDCYFTTNLMYLVLQLAGYAYFILIVKKISTLKLVFYGQPSPKNSKNQGILSSP